MGLDISYFELCDKVKKYKLDDDDYSYAILQPLKLI